MNVSPIDGWRLPGCSSDCWPRKHNPLAHEAYGRMMALMHPPVRVVRTGPLVVDLDAMTVCVNDRPITLIAQGGGDVPRRWELLAVLAERCGAVVPYTVLVRTVLGYPVERPGWRDQGRRNICVISHRLRLSLGEAGSLVVTVEGVGLRLERVAAQKAAP